MLRRSSRRALSSPIDYKYLNEGTPSPAKRQRVDQAENKRKVKASQNSENLNPGPSTSKAKILPRHSRQALSEIVIDEGSQKDKLKVDGSSKKNVVKNKISTIVPISADTEENLNVGNEVLLNVGEAIADNDEDIVEVDVPKQVFEEVLLTSDNEDDSVKLASGSSGSTSRTQASTSRKIETIKIEDPAPQSAITPQRQKLVLDPSILTPPTADPQENAAKYWKCLQFLGQSELNPDAQEFVPGPPKVSNQTADVKPSDCVVCLEPRETTFVNLPCAHAVTCGPCSDQLELLGKDCPVCRTPILTRFQIYN